MIPNEILRLIWALLMTVVIETAAALIIGVRDRYDFWLIVAVNMITNPTINVVAAAVNSAAHRFQPYAVAALEIAVVFAEAAVFKNRLAYKKMRPLLFSLILNAVSFSTGLILSGLSRT